jgi:colanic acid biosynthesis glycosyl transferase WcaI
MNVLLLSRYFPPEIGTAANLFFELARGLTRRGHQVTVVTNFPWYNLKEIPERYRKGFFMREEREGMTVVRVRFPLFGPLLFRLIVGHLTVPFTTFLGALTAKGKFDGAYIYSPPLFMGLVGWAVTLFRGIPFVFGVQDLHPQAYIDQGRLTNPLVIWLLHGIEKFCYRKASLITVHSEGNRAHMMEKKGVSGDKIRILHNWIDTDEMKPLPRDNDFSREHGLNARFVVGYAGTLSVSQGLLSIVEAARLLKERQDIEFFIVGDGVEKDAMVAKAEEYSLEHIRFLPMQTKSVYPLVVASSDVGLVTLNAKVTTPVVPSKILSMMAAARPVLASMPLDGDAPKLIAVAKCGICIGPENPSELAEKIAFMAEHREACEAFSEAGRAYVVEHFSLERVLEEVEGIVGEVGKKRGKKLS